jgi:outer membrane protein assembly factor BamB
MDRIMGRKRAARTFVAGALVLSVLSACAENDVILPGKRENLRSVLETEEAAAGARRENEARSISLPQVSANASWAQSPGTPDSRTANAALTTPLTPLWSANIGAGDSRKQRITAAPVIAGGRIFTLDAETLVTATSLAGERVWQTDIRSDRDKSGQATGGGLAFADGRLFITSGYGMMVALDAASGKEIWRQRLEGTGSGNPTVVGGIVYMTAGDDRGYALTADEGRLLWTLVSSPDVNNVLGAPAPAVSGDLAVFAFGSGEVQAVFRRGGLRRWDASVSGERLGTALGNVGDVTGSPVIVGKTVYIGNQSGRTVALNLDSGARRWTVEEGAVGQIVPAGDSVFLISDLNELLRLDARDGSRIWGVPLPKFTRDRPTRRSTIFAHHGPVLAGGQLHVASDDGLIRSFDPTNGALVSTVEIPGGATSDPAVAGGVLYVVSTKGKLHAFR